MTFKDNFGLFVVTTLRSECARPEHFRNNVYTVNRSLNFYYLITLHLPKAYTVVDMAVGTEVFILRN